MVNNTQLEDAQTKSKLGALWVFIVLNVIFKDIHDLFLPGLIEQMNAGIMGGNIVTAELLLAGSIAVEIPLAMTLASRILEADVNRWTNLIVGVLAAPLLLAPGFRDLDDYFFAAVELAALGAVIWTAWRWRPHATVDPRVEQSALHRRRGPRLPGSG